MVFITRLVMLIVCFAVGILMVLYREKIARTVGKNDLAEKYLGPGGTYTMWVLIGVITIFVGAMIMLGKCQYF